MKRILLLAVLLLGALTASAQSGKSIYQKYSDADNVSAVYISPAMFRLIGKIPDLEVGDNNVNLAPLIRSLSGLYIINSENPRVNDKLSSEVSRFISSYWGPNEGGARRRYYHLTISGHAECSKRLKEWQETKSLLDLLLTTEELLDPWYLKAEMFQT